jgi:nucleoside-diphosphate-sugar epimerase
MKILVTGGSGFIGTNFIDQFSKLGHTITNYSLHPPLDPEHKQYWLEGDIMRTEALQGAFEKFQPDHVLHLAARAECDENTTVEKGYKVNTEGTQNVLDAIRATPSVQRVIITSSQFVCGPGPLPKNDSDYFPATVYGESKAISEKLTRAANLPVIWTIIRPTNIWGPWHMRYRREFWRVVQRGLYIHPGRQPVIRCYGYVKNVIDQIRKIFEAPRELVHGKTIYVGDRPTDLFDWVNGFSKALTGKPVRIVPRPLMRALALAGDLPSRLTGKPFLINSSRLRSMTTEYNTPIAETFELLGENPYSLEAGIQDTVEWLRNYQGPDVRGGGD